jgi:(heptosyl)LPS beta-1,4-glucosyltransferase
MGKISVVINTLNEEENLPRALASVDSFAYEVVVVDMHSEDKTVQIAKKAGARVFTHKREGYVEPARNFAISKAKGDWIFLLDADEEVPKSLVKELSRLSNEDADYYAVPRKNIIFGKWIKHSNWWPDYNVRFFKKGAVEWDNAIHSVPLTSGKGADVEVKEELAIVHHHYTSVTQYLLRHERYSSVMAKEKRKKKEKFIWRHLISKPTGEFLSRYFAGQGYKDGVHGLVLAGLQGFVEFLTYVKLWELSKFPERELTASEVAKELKGAQKEINYWIADTKYKEEGGISNQIKRKFRLP